MCYNAKRGENMKLAIDAMSGDLGSSIVVEACQSFLNKNKTDELYVVGKIEELEALKDHPQVTLIDAREIFEMTENILSFKVGIVAIKHDFSIPLIRFKNNIAHA